jgi:hypothetical protein
MRVINTKRRLHSAIKRVESEQQLQHKKTVRQVYKGNVIWQAVQQEQKEAVKHSICIAH